MTDAVEQVQGEELQGQQQEQQEQVETTEQGGEAPYGPQSILDQLDEFSQQKIRDQLFEMEKNATSRIESVNQKYAAWKSFEDQGYTPEQFNSMVALVTELNNDPKAFYDRMGSYLQQNGLLPTQENVQKAAEAVASGDDQGQGSTETDEIARLRKELEDRLSQFDQRETERTQQAQYEQQVAQFQQQIQLDVDAVKQAHPEYSGPDLQEIARIVETENLRRQSVPNAQLYTFREGAEYYETNVRQRILSTPRPGQAAPKLVPTGGNVAVETDNRRASEMGAREFAKDAADWIRSQQERG